MSYLLPAIYKAIFRKPLLHIIGVLEEEENLFQEIIAENLPIRAAYTISGQTDFSVSSVGNEALIPTFTLYTWPLGCQTNAHLFRWQVAYS